MIPIVSIKTGLRQEGLNYGVPVTFITLGGVDRLEIEDILKEVLSKSVKRSWVCIVGEEFDPLSFGIGTLVKGLSQLQRYVEVETDGLHRDPSWTHTVDRWVVDFQDKSSYNLGSLRASDTIRIKVDSLAPEVAFEVKEVLEITSKINCVKYLKVPKGTQKKWLGLISKFERVRVY